MNPTIKNLIQDHLAEVDKKSSGFRKALEGLTEVGIMIPTQMSVIQEVFRTLRILLGDMLGYLEPEDISLEKGMWPIYLKDLMESISFFKRTNQPDLVYFLSEFYNQLHRLLKSQTAGIQK